MDLKRLLAPSSIAIVGASERPSIGRTILQALEVLGYQGAIYPVHPRNKTVLGQTCYASLDAIPEPIDLVAICLGQERILGEVEKAATLGVGAIVIYSGGFAEAGDEGRAQQDEIVRLCRDNNIVLCGPNCMGVMGLHQGSHAYMMDILDADALRGNVGLISQSGSISIGMLTDTRRYGFSHIISTGNEALISTAAYMEYLIDDSETEIIALFSESIKEPDRFVAALDRAAQAGKPVVVLKAGKSARAAAAIQTHTGGMAGQARVFSAVLKAHNAIEVNDLEELTEVLSVLQGARLPTGDRIAVVTGSGGHAELLLDMSSRANINLPPLPEKTREAIEAGVGSLTGDGNPIDAWGQGDFSENFMLAFGEAARSGAYDAVVLSIDANDGQAVDYLGQDRIVTRLLIDTNASIELPLYLMSTRHGVQKSIQVNAIREHGIAAISGMVQGLGAIGRVALWNNRAASADAPSGQTVGTVPDWASRVSVHEFDAKQLLADAGLSITDEQIVTTLEAAQDAAEAIGFPVVMKAVGDRIPHRSEHGLIELRLSDRETIGQAWSRLQERLSAMGDIASDAGIVVQAMAASGVEVIAGIARDPSFGLVLAVGPGGVLAELLDEVQMVCLPMREGDVDRLLEGGKLEELLRGFRGAGPADVEALKASLHALADFATLHAPFIEGIDINPLIVHGQGQGCVAVDALIVPRLLVG